MHKTRFFFLIGLFIFCWATYKIYKEYTFIKNGILTQGRVVEMSRMGSGFAPRVAYLIQDGQEYGYVPPLGSSNPDARVGDFVSMVYNRENPKKVRILKFQYTFIFGWFLACLGGTMDNNVLSFLFGIVTFLFFSFCVLFGYTLTLLISLFIASFWLFWIYYEVKHIRNGIPIEAEVVELIHYKPRVVFTTQDRQEISYTPRWANTFPGVRVGDKVFVVYQRSDPYQAMILKFRYSFCMSWGFTCLMIATAIFCGGALIGNLWLNAIARSGGM